VRPKRLYIIHQPATGDKSKGRGASFRVVYHLEPLGGRAKYVYWLRQFLEDVYTRLSLLSAPGLKWYADAGLCEKCRAAPLYGKWHLLESPSREYINGYCERHAAVVGLSLDKSLYSGPPQHWFFSLDPFEVVHIAAGNYYRYSLRLNPRYARLELVRKSEEPAKVYYYRNRVHPDGYASSYNMAASFVRSYIAVLRSHLRGPLPSGERAQFEYMPGKPFEVITSLRW